MNGVLPEGWLSCRIADVVQPVPNTRPEDTPDREFGYLDISAISNRTYTIGEVRRFRGADAPSRARRPIAPGDVLFSNVRTYLRNVALVPDDLAAELCSTGFTVLRTNGAVDPSFLFRYVLTDEFIGAVTPLQTGSNYPATSDRVVMEQVIPLAPLAEQRRIVAAVEALLARVDAARQRLARVPEILKRFRQAVLAAACSGVLTDDWRAAATLNQTVPSLQALCELRRASWKSRSKGRFCEPQPLGCPTAIPRTWLWATLDHVVAAGPQNGLYKPGTSYGEGMPIVRIDDYQDGWTRARSQLTRLRLSDAEALTYSLHPGDILINRVNSLTHLGKALLVDEALCPAVFESNMMRFSLLPGVAPAWAHLYLRSSQGKDRLIARRKWAVNQASINQSDVLATPIPLPPLEEQHEIVRRVQALFALADSVEQRVAPASARADRLTQAILSKAFRGELVPTEAELARREGREYEPAAVLLERIRAEREARGARGKAGQKPGSRGAQVRLRL